MLFLREAKGLKDGSAGLAKPYLGCEEAWVLLCSTEGMGTETILIFHLVPKGFTVRLP